MIFKKGLVICGAVVAMVVLTMASMEIVYADQMMPGLTIDGRSFTGQNRSQILHELTDVAQEYNQQGIVFTLKDKKQIASLSDLGISFDLNTTLNQAFTASHRRFYGLGTLNVIWHIAHRATNIPLALKVNNQVRSDYFNNRVYPAFSQPPTDASLNLTADPIAVIPEQSGNWIDDQALTHAVLAAATSHEQVITIPTTIKAAEVHTNDLNQASTEAQSWLNRHITLTAATKKIVPSKTDIAGWISLETTDSGVHAQIDPEKVRNYLTQIASAKVNQTKRDQIQDPNEGVIQSGRDGIKIKLDESQQAMLNGLQSNDQDINIKLVVDVNSSSTLLIDPQDGSTPGLFPDKYIEINLTKQRLYLYIGTQFVNSFRVSTGKWSTPTPVGTFAVSSKSNPAYSQSYGLYMPLWNAITPDGKYGIHGLPYKGSWHETTSHLGTPVSHGCIRLGPGNDQNVYDWAPIGTPVNIHK